MYLGPVVGDAATW